MPGVKLEYGSVILPFSLATKNVKELNLVGGFPALKKVWEKVGWIINLITKIGWKDVILLERDQLTSGLRLNGALSVAQTDHRWQELLKQANTTQLYDVEVRILDKETIKKIFR